MWWEWVVKGYIVIWTAGTVFLAVVLLWHTIRHGTTPLAEVFLPLAVLFWLGCWRAFLLHRWAVIAVCVLGWLLSLLLSAHTSSPGDSDTPKDQEPWVLVYWLSIGLFSAAAVVGWKHWLSGF